MLLDRATLDFNLNNSMKFFFVSLSFNNYIVRFVAFYVLYVTFVKLNYYGGAPLNFIDIYTILDLTLAAI